MKASPNIQVTAQEGPSERRTLTANASINVGTGLVPVRETRLPGAFGTEASPVPTDFHVN